MTQDPLLDRVFVPIASETDARATARALRPYVRDADGRVVVGHVIEKAGGAPDKASVEQRREHAGDLFGIVGDVFAADDIPHECHVLFGTDVAERILAAAEEFEADSIAFTPRGGSRWLKLLTGDVSHSLMTESDRPVVVLPDVAEGETDG